MGCLQTHETIIADCVFLQSMPSESLYGFEKKIELLYPQILQMYFKYNPSNYDSHKITFEYLYLHKQFDPLVSAMCKCLVIMDSFYSYSEMTEYKLLKRRYLAQIASQDSDSDI